MPYRSTNALKDFSDLFHGSHSPNIFQPDSSLLLGSFLSLGGTIKKFRSGVDILSGLVID
jgi:hypothetical protein